ncbi:hypothetical protein V5R04_15500 [Jonesiaceae bacterium BS-20]|uniref:Uncharacterized protein n=1 Tax=Jonesiaceae bacterium BS-20 TaxID=3120821 RepID=A0AAU7DX15_9MICO
MTMPTGLGAYHFPTDVDYKFCVADWLRANPDHGLARDGRGRLTSAAILREESSLPPVTDPTFIWERYRHEAVALTTKRKEMYIERGAWEIETAWEQPEIWVPRSTACSRCEAQKVWVGHRYTYCSRPEGHGGRHAAYGFPDHSGQLIRVMAVWP